MDQFISLLYDGSPFCPPVTEISVTQIKYEIIMKLPPIVAIAKEVGLQGVNQSLVVDSEFPWVADAFKITKHNLLDFMLGFAMPTSLIIGGYATKERGVEAAIKSFCPPTEDPLMIAMNQYKSYHLFTAYGIISATIDRLPLIGAAPIYQLCKVDAFKNDFYYLAGISASERLFGEYANRLYPL